MSSNTYLETYIKELKQVYYLIASMQNTHTITQMLTLMLEESLSLIHATSGVVVFRHRQSDKLYPYTSKGFNSTLIKDSQLTIGEGITGTVIREGISKIINDTSLDPKYIAIDPTIYSEIVVPIKINDYTIGALVLDHTQKNAFTDKHLELIQLITGQAGFIISHFLDTAQLKKNTQLLEFFLSLSHSHSSTEIFDLLTKELNTVGACIIDKKGEKIFQQGVLCADIEMNPQLFTTSHSYILSQKNQDKVPYTRIIIPRDDGDMTFIADKVYYFSVNSEIDIKFTNKILEILAKKDSKLQNEYYSDDIIEQWVRRQMQEPSGSVYDISMGIIEQQLIKAALKKNKDNRLKTAQFLGINRNTLRHKMEIYHLD